MSKPNYRVTLTFDPERKVFLARAPELEHCSAEGATRGEAIGNLEQEIDAQLANMLSHGSAPPKSVDEEEFSGDLTVKVSRTLHRDLAWQARSEGLDLPHLVGELMAAALEGRRQTHRGPRSGNRQPEQPHHGNDNIGNRHDGGRRQGFGGGRGTQVLDDRATFIEYVRGLEQGGGQHQRGPGGGGHGGHNHNNNNNGRRGNRGGRGGRGGSGGGGFRHDGQPRHGGGPPRQDGYAAAPQQPSAPAAPNGGAPPSGNGPAGNDDAGNT